MNHFPRAWLGHEDQPGPGSGKICCSGQLCSADDRSCRALYAAEFYSVLDLIYLSIWMQKHDEYTASAHAHRDVGSNYTVSYLGPC